jgi:hypothetical protein
MRQSEWIIPSTNRCRQEDGADMQTDRKNTAYFCLHPSQGSEDKYYKENLLAGLLVLHALESRTAACTVYLPIDSLARRARVLSFSKGCRQKDDADMQTDRKKKQKGVCTSWRSSGMSSNARGSHTCGSRGGLQTPGKPVCMSAAAALLSHPDRVS